MVHNPVTLCGLDSNNNPEALSSSSNGLVTRSTDYILDVLSGKHPTDSFNRKFFFRSTGLTAAGGYQTVWSANTNFSPITTASTFTITYNNATDGEGTTGALILLFTYLDENKDEVGNVFHTLGNTGSDVTAFSGLGINRCVVFSAGSNMTNANDITITATTGGSTQGQIPANYGVTQQSILHLPRNCVPFSPKVKVTAEKLSGSNPAVSFRVNVFSRVTNVNYIVGNLRVDTSVSASDTDTVELPLSGQDVIWLTCDTDRDGTIAGGDYSIITRLTT